MNQSEDDYDHECYEYIQNDNSTTSFQDIDLDPKTTWQSIIIGWLACSSILLCPLYLFFSIITISTRPQLKSLIFSEKSGYPASIMILTSFMLSANFIYTMTQRKYRKRSLFTVLTVLFTSTFTSNLCKFLQLSDKFHQPFQQRSNLSNTFLLNALSMVTSNSYLFDTNSFLIVLDSGASSSATPFKSDFIKNSYKEIHGVTISGGVLVNLHFNKVLHLEKLPTRLLSP